MSIEITKNDDGSLMIIDGDGFLGFLTDLKNELESAEMTMEREWGKCRSLEKVIEAKDMTGEWDEVCSMINQLA